MLATLKIPTAYYQFPQGTAQKTPFICFFYDGSDDFYADNKNYKKIRTLQIELYTDEKDFTLEAQVENLLDSYGLTYTVTESDIDSERMHETVYTTEINIEEETTNADAGK